MNRGGSLRLNLAGPRLCAPGLTAIDKHRLEHQPQLVDCRSQVPILLATSIRAFKTMGLRTAHCAAPGPMDTGALRKHSD